MASILVIDDDQKLRAVLRHVLERAGYTVAEACNGKDGLQQSRQTPADLVITDIFMEEQEGLETIQQLRREFPHVPIIAMSGGMMGGAFNFLDAAKMLGARTTLEKPFTPTSLLEAVRQTLSQD